MTRVGVDSSFPVNWQACLQVIIVASLPCCVVHHLLLREARQAMMTKLDRPA